MTTSHTAQGLASLGRHGDTMLVHMSPHEVAGLNYLAKKQGTKLTINPDTGLPEAFKLGGFFKSLLPTIVGGAASMIPGMQFASYPMLTGILAGAATGAITNKDDPLMGGLMGGLGGYSGASIMGAGKTAAGAMGSAEAAKSAGIGGGSSGLTTGGGFIPGATSGVDLAYNNAMMAAQTGGAANSAISGASGAMDVDKLLAAGRPIGMANTFASTASLPPNPTFLGNVKDAFKGIGGAATGNQAAIDAYTKGIGAESAMGALGKTALPIGGAVLGGLEPSDIYGEPINMDEAKKKQAYDPYATLNLGNDTGLRLVAEGGYIDGYAVGGTVTTGGLRDLYGTVDSPTNPQLSRDGYGVGRLDSLAREQAMTQAQTTGYAMGGPVSFADGGDTNSLTDEIQPIGQDMGLTSLMPPATTPPAPGQAMSAQSVQNAATALSDTASSDSSIIAQVANNLRTNPNYQPKNPIEASIVNQLKGTDPMQEGQPSQQGLGSIAPSQPMAPTYNASQSMAPSFNPSVAMGPTYFAGINAPRGYADGGDVVAGEKGMNLGALPTLNLNFVNKPITGEQLQNKDVMMTASLGNPWAAYGVNPDNYDGGLNKIAGLAGGIKNKIPFTKGFKEINAARPTSYALNLNSGQQQAQYAQGGYLDGQGDGMSDSIPATIEGKQPARLADGEFVIPADVVSHLGNGSSKAGSKRLYAMLDKVRHARTGNKKQGKEIKAEKYLPA